MDNWLTIVMTLAGLLGGGVGVWLINLYKERNSSKLAAVKQTSEEKRAQEQQLSTIKIAENEQAFQIFKHIVDELQENVHTLNEGMKRSEKQHLECRQENAELKGRIQLVEDKIIKKEVTNATDTK